MHIAHELRQELVLLLGDAGRTTYPFLAQQTLQSIERMYAREKQLGAEAATPDLVHAVFRALRREEGVIDRKVERGQPFYSLTPTGRVLYDQLHALHTGADRPVLV